MTGQFSAATIRMYGNIVTKSFSLDLIDVGKYAYKVVLD